MKDRPNVQAARLDLWCGHCGSLQQRKLDRVNIRVNKHKELVFSLLCVLCGTESVFVRPTTGFDDTSKAEKALDEIGQITKKAKPRATKKANTGDTKDNATKTKKVSDQ